MNWELLKSGVYYLDGSLRDIYVLNTTRSDWQLWADFVNTNYTVSIQSYDDEEVKNKIGLAEVIAYWDAETYESVTSTVYVGNVLVNTHFFVEEEIENDVLPTEVESIEDHNRLMEYLKGVSKTLNKEVMLTTENLKEVVLIAVNGDTITYTFTNSTL